VDLEADPVDRSAVAVALGEAFNLNHARVSPQFAGGIRVIPSFAILVQGDFPPRLPGGQSLAGRICRRAYAITREGQSAG
jgi:hypothetical protein